MQFHRPKKRHLTKNQYELLKQFCEKQGWDDVFIIIKTLYEKKLVNEDLIFLLESGLTLPDNTINKIEFIVGFYRGCDVTILAAFVKKLKAVDRKKLFETYELTPVERYIYNTLLNAQKNNTRLSTKAILSNLQKYKGVKIDSNNIEGYYRRTIKKMRRKLTNKNHYLKRREVYQGEKGGLLCR